MGGTLSGVAEAREVPLISAGEVELADELTPGEFSDFTSASEADEPPPVEPAALPCSPRRYLAYCVVCLLLTAVLLAATIWQAVAPRKEVHVWRHVLRPWEEACEVSVGAALCAETLLAATGGGWRSVGRDRWRLFDTAVAGLTLLGGVFFLLRRMMREVEDVVEDVDIPMLLIRFLLQPLRMLSTANMVCRAHRLRKKRKRPPEALVLDPRIGPEATSPRSILSPEMASELCALLPSYLRFLKWDLAYSPRLDGTSLRTFYRRQVGPNFLVIRDARGGIFGGFAAESWRPETSAYGSGESFVFVARWAEEGSCIGNGRSEVYRLPLPTPDAGAAPTSSRFENVANGEEEALAGSSAAPAESLQMLHLEVFRYVGGAGKPLQWSDQGMIGLGMAFVIRDEFTRGTARECESFDTTALSAMGGEFIIQDFECWSVGGNAIPRS